MGQVGADSCNASQNGGLANCYDDEGMRLPPQDGATSGNYKADKVRNSSWAN